MGLGDSVDEPLLQKIAVTTGGKYYSVKVSQELIEVFKRIQEETGVIVDNDKDGIPDWVELAGMRAPWGESIITDPNNMDTDGDGLNDGEETGPVILAGKAYSMKTDPSKRDTDGDGYNDREDLKPKEKYIPTTILLHGVTSNVGNVFGAYNKLATKEGNFENNTDKADPTIFANTRNQEVINYDKDGFYFKLINKIGRNHVKVFNYANKAYVEDSASNFETYLNNLRLPKPTATDKPIVNVVAHSMGGLVTRAFYELGEWQYRESPVEMKSIITWATPHFGTYIDEANWLWVDAFDNLDKDSDLWKKLNSDNQNQWTQYIMFIGTPLEEITYIAGYPGKQIIKTKKNAPNTPKFIVDPGASKDFLGDARNVLAGYTRANNYVINSNDGWVDINSGLGYSGGIKIGNVDANQYLKGKRWIVVGPHTSVEHTVIHHNLSVWEKTIPWLL